MRLLLGTALVVMTLSSFVFLNQDAIIQEVSSQSPLWVSGHNHYFDGQTMDEIKILMGSLETPEEIKLPLKNVEELKDIPTNFDSRTAWPNCESIQEVRDQSTCGSCWAFGAVEAISDRICIHSNQTLQTRISAEDLLTCCGFSCGNGCNGGYPSAAWSYWKNTGIVTGWLYNTTEYCLPYTFAPCNHHVDGKYPNCSSTKPTPKCTKTCISSYGTNYTQDKHHGASAYSIANNVAKIQTEIMTNGPVEVSFTVYNDFLTYKSGVYHHVSGAALGGHAVKMIGWGVENNTPYWLLANSWNEGWGDQGFFKIKRGNNECGIEGSVVAGLPKLQQQLIEA